MDYKYLPADSQQDAVARAIREREREHHNYEVNRLNYEAILASDQMQALPEQWPARLQGLQGVFGEKLAAAVQGDDYNLVVNLQFRDRIRVLLATTLAEQGKCEAVYWALHQRMTQPEVEVSLARIDQKAAANNKP